MSRQPFIYRGDIIEAIADVLPILAVDMASGEIVFASPPLEAMFGYRVGGELIGMNVGDLVPSDKKELHAQHRVDFAQNPHSRPMGAGLKLEGQRQDGTIFPVEIGLAPRVVNGRRLVIAMVMDMTTRHAAGNEAKS